ncbi:hypothetical protein [Fictibacillus barbaricus]|uniref:Amino acid transporter n=1 Tax=Fictibacillus barbaricus TaxID=182136 RepID=A0ABU1TWP1_9BACL|nr:hypothetical protein [Fictibacillus barbaricus]MDR7071574.1 hypothetical protein [Fictibacillus barbaricus]
MKKIHETQSIRTNDTEEHKVYSPIENLQNIESGGPLNKKGLENVSGLPKSIKFLGCVLIGLLGFSMLLVMVLNFF